ncbi:MAG: hypothetical protein WCQ95_13890 [Bacteroidota bacterium]
MKNYLVLLLSVFMFSSCGNKPNSKGEFVIKPNNQSKELRIKYTNDGNIEYIKEYVKDQPEGLVLNFVRGNLKDISQLKEEKNNGCGIAFHNDGSLNNFGKYENGLKTGWFYVFDKSELLTGKREYITVEGAEFLNQWIEYKSDGTVDKTASNYIKVSPIKDTIKQGDEYVLNVCLEAAYFKQYMIMVVGPFDTNYALPKGANCDTVKSLNFVASYKTKNYKKGNNTIRGMVQDVQLDEKDPKKINVRKIYFTHNFRVK